MRTPLASTSKGVVQDGRGNAERRTVTVTMVDGSPAAVYVAAVGAALLTTVTSDGRGYLPGYVEDGDYLIDGELVSVVTFSSVGGSGAGFTKPAADATGATDASAAVLSALGIQASRTIYSGPGTFLIDFLDIPAGDYTFIGDGGGRTVFRARATAAAEVLNMFEAKAGAGKLRFEGIRFEAGAYGSATSEARAFSTFGETVDVRFDHCEFEGFTYAAKVDGDVGGSIDMLFFDCDINGRAAAGESLGVGFFAAAGSGSRLRMIGGSITNIGLLASQLRHGIYLYDHNDMHVEGVRFDGGVGTGWGIHVANGSQAAPHRHVIRDCTFDYATADVNGAYMRAILTSSFTRTRITGCHGKTGQRAISWQGLADMDRCKWEQTLNTDYHINIEGGAFAAVCGGTITDNEFTGACSTWLRSSAATRLDWHIARNRLDIEQAGGTRKITGTATNLAGSRWIVEDNVLGNASDLAALVQCNFTGGTYIIRGNKLYHGGSVLDSGAIVLRLVVEDNDISCPTFNTGASVQTAHVVRGNTGSNTGCRDRNSGVASTQNAQNIAHGLGNTQLPITPSRYAILPRVATRIGVATAVTITNLTIGLADHAGVAIAVNENVAWWAEA